MSLAKPKSAGRAIGDDASALINLRIAQVGGWRGTALARMRALVLAADDEMVEEWKWMGTPVWSCHGNVCTGEIYKQVVKLTFARGAALPDPKRVFNSSLDGNTRRAIDLREGEAVDEHAFTALVKAAVALNRAKTAKPAKAATPAKGATKAKAAKPAKAAKAATKAKPAKKPATRPAKKPATTW